MNTVDPCHHAQYTRIVPTQQKKVISFFVLRLKKKESSIKIRLIENFNLESDRFDLVSPHLFSPSAEMGLGNIFNILIT